MKIRHSVASLFIVLLPLLICFLPSSSYALFVTDQLTINITPVDPNGAFSSLTGGEAAIFQIVQVGDKTEINLIDDILVPNLNAGDSFTTKTTPSDPMIPGDPMFFAFAGFSGPTGTEFTTQAFPTGDIPGNPVTPFEQINIGTFGSSLTPLTMSGPIYAFDTTVQVGTWEVTVTPVPEPSTLVLLGAGLAGVGVVRRRGRR